MEGTNRIDNRIIEGLRSLEQGEGEFSRFAAGYRELLQIQVEATFSARVVRPDLSEDRDRGRLREGVPLLPFEDFQPDWAQVEAVFKQVLVWSARNAEAPDEASGPLSSLGSPSGFLREAAEGWYRGLSLKTLAGTDRIEAERMAAVIETVLKPFLSAYSRLLQPEVNQELWRRNTCPVCGGKPDFSCLKEGGTRWLLCSRCDAEWLFFRIECPYCGSKDQETLAYWSDEASSGLYRLYVCESCRTYLKAIDLRISGTDPLWPLERVLTLDLDRQGQERGYAPGWTASNGVPLHI